MQTRNRTKHQWQMLQVLLSNKSKFPSLLGCSTVRLHRCNHCFQRRSFMKLDFQPQKMKEKYVSGDKIMINIVFSKGSVLKPILKAVKSLFLLQNRSIQEKQCKHLQNCMKKKKKNLCINSTKCKGGMSVQTATTAQFLSSFQ